MRMLMIPMAVTMSVCMRVRDSHIGRMGIQNILPGRGDTGFEPLDHGVQALFRLHVGKQERAIAADLSGVPVHDFERRPYIWGKIDLVDHQEI